MNESLTSSLMLLVVLIFIQAIVAIMYFALANTRKSVLEELADEGSERAERTLKLAENATDLLATQQYVSVLLSIISTAVLVRYVLPRLETQMQAWGAADQGIVLITFLLVLPLFSLLILLIGYQLPSAIVSGQTESIAIFSHRPISLLVTGITPLLRLTEPFSKSLGQALGGSGKVVLVTEEEIKTLVDAGSEGGAIENDEKEMIYSVFKFGDTLAREVMVPRIDIEALELETNIKEALDKVITVGHSRIPVYEDTIDNIKGLLYAKDLLSLWRSGDHERKKLSDILREPYFIPESKRAVDLLEELQQRKIHIAVVIDEYGGTAGLVTIEDLLEEIVGEIRDEYDLLEEEPYEKISDTEYIFTAGIDLDDVNELLDSDLPTEENDTLGGYIFTELGKVPEMGDRIHAHGIEIEVLTLDGRRINKVRVRVVEELSEDDTREEPLTTPEPVKQEPS